MEGYDLGLISVFKYRDELYETYMSDPKTEDLAVRSVIHKLQFEY